MRLATLLLAAAFLSSNAHFVWQTDNDDNTTSLVFSETAGKAGLKVFLSSLEAVTEMSFQGTQDEDVRQNLTFTTEGSMEAASFVASLPNGTTAPYVLESFVPYGIFSEGGATALLQYYATAPKVATPNDWYAASRPVRDRTRSECRRTICNHQLFS